MYERLKFLIIEDRQEDILLLSRKLGKLFKNSIIESSKSLEEFPSILAKFKPDVIFSDYDLVTFTGLDVFEIVKSKAPDLPFIIVTGVLDEESIVDSLKQGVWDYILKDKLNKIEAAVIRCLDIKKEKEARRESDEKIKTNEAKLRALVENNPFPMWISDTEGTVVTTNLALRETLNLEDSQIVGEYNVLKDENLQDKAIQSKIELLMTEHKTIHFTIFWRAGKAKDVDFRRGKDLWIEVTMFPLLDNRGKLVNIVCQWFDLTERKKAEEEILTKNIELKKQYANAKFWSDIVENALFGISIGYPDGRLGRSNKKYCELTGYTLSELQSINWNEVLTPPEWLDLEMQALKKLHETKNTVVYEKEYIRKDGSRVPIELTVHPNLNNEGEIENYYAFVIDISDRKKRESELKKIEWLLEKESSSIIPDYIPEYGDVTFLNKERTILDAVGKEMLTILSSDIMDLLNTSIAVYEKNGDYAFGMFQCSWCQIMDSASRKLCATDDNKDALSCGKWLCHENCWNESAKAAMRIGKSTDIECIGGIRLYAEPIYAGDTIVGVINIGYGNPPSDEDTIKKLADEFQVDYKTLLIASNDYKARPPFIIDIAKRRLKSTAEMIGNMVLRKKMEDELEMRLGELEIFNEAAVGRELMINEHRKEVNNLLIELGRKPKYEIVE